jgi:hypothetical protein
VSTTATRMSGATGSQERISTCVASISFPGAYGWNNPILKDFLIPVQSAASGKNNHSRKHGCGEQCPNEANSYRATSDMEYIKFAGRLVSGKRDGPPVDKLVSCYQRAWGKCFPSVPEVPMANGRPVDHSLDPTIVCPGLPWLQAFIGGLK